MNFTFNNPFTLKMLQTQNGNNWPCSFQEAVKNVKLSKHDRQRPMEIGYLSDSGDLLKHTRLLCKIGVAIIPFTNAWFRLKLECKNVI